VSESNELRALEEFARTIIPAKFAAPEIKMGVCIDVQYRYTHTGTIGTATITLGGSTSAISGVRWLKRAEPVIGCTVVLIKSGPDYFIIGVIADANHAKQWLTARVISGIFGTGVLTMGWTRTSGTPGIIQFGNVFIVSRPGNYRLTASITVQGSGNNWFILAPRQYRGAVNLFTSDVVGGTGSASAFTCITSDFIFEMQASDFFQIDISSSAAGNTLDGRSSLVIEEV
jgi:hypothetical protein